jgi:hypothetical protein
MPDWLPFALWPLVVALLTSASSEGPKWLLFKRTDSPGWGVWSRSKQTTKVLMLASILAPVGALWGLLIYPRTGIESDYVLAFALGGATGVMTPPLRDFAFWLPSFAKRALKVRAGVTEATVTMDTIDPVEDAPTLDGR